MEECRIGGVDLPGRWRETLTGQVPPAMTRSNDKASGIPVELVVLPELIDSAFSTSVTEEREEST